MDINVGRRQAINGLIQATLFAGMIAVGLSNALSANDPPAPKADDFSPYVAKDGPAQEHKEHKATATVTVRMTDALRFKPARITIHAGDTVEWKNTSSIVHTVTADAHRAQKGTKVVLPAGAAPFDSGNIKAGDSYRHTFTVPGTYKYICVPHAELGMTGEVVVEPRASAPHSK